MDRGPEIMASRLYTQRPSKSPNPDIRLQRRTCFHKIYIYDSRFRSSVIGELAAAPPADGERFCKAHCCCYSCNCLTRLLFTKVKTIFVCHSLGGIVVKQARAHSKKIMKKVTWWLTSQPHNRHLLSPTNEASPTVRLHPQ